jgi:hypothetical protein
MADICETQCIKNTNSSTLTKEEEDCSDICSEKYIRFHAEIGILL